MCVYKNQNSKEGYLNLLLIKSGSFTDLQSFIESACLLMVGGENWSLISTIPYNE
jgi:hypothetical protein